MPPTINFKPTWLKIYNVSLATWLMMKIWEIPIDMLLGWMHDESPCIAHKWIPKHSLNLIKQIWHTYITFFFHVENIPQCSTNWSSKCYCCPTGNIEIISNLLLHGCLTRYIWHYFSDTFCYANPGFYTLSYVFQDRVAHGTTKSIERLCYILVPIMICWEI